MSIELCSRNGSCVHVTEQQCQLSPILRSNNYHELPCSSELLDKFASYLEYHDGEDVTEIKKPIHCSDMIKLCEHKWDAYFIDDIASSTAELYELMMLARQLQITPLIDLCCVKFSTFIKGKPLHLAIQHLR